MRRCSDAGTIPSDVDGGGTRPPGTIPSDVDGGGTRPPAAMIPSDVDVGSHPGIPSRGIPSDVDGTIRSDVDGGDHLAGTIRRSHPTLMAATTWRGRCLQRE